MRVLVTGASGHVGGGIAAHLAAEGHEVVGVSRRDEGPAGLVQRVCSDLRREAFVEHLRASAAPCSAIVHAAASLAKEPLDASLAETNCVGLQRVLALAAAWNVERFVFISGIPVIGRPLQLPITEAHPTNPETVYHASKLFGEHAVGAFFERREGVHAVSLRLPSPVGPGMPENRILSVFVKRARTGEPLRILGQGSRRQNYIDVRDVGRAVACALNSEASGVFNIASESTVSNLELARLCIRCCNSSSAIEFADQPDPEEGIAWEVATGKAAHALGFRPVIPIEDSIQAVAEDYAHRTD